MRVTLLVIACIFVIGCAATPAIEEKISIEKPFKEIVRVAETIQEKPAEAPTPEISNIYAQQEGVVTKLKGIAYIHDSEDEEFVILLERNIVPIGKVFYLEPRTTMKIEQDSGKDIYLYSKEHDTYYKLEKEQQ